jgi:hypothetical protein
VKISQRAHKCKIENVKMWGAIKSLQIRDQQIRYLQISKAVPGREQPKEFKTG